MADVCPYTASSTMLRALLPDFGRSRGGIDAMLGRLADPDSRARIRRDIESRNATGQSLVDRIGWENVMIASCSRAPGRRGKRISEIARGRGVDAVDAALELLMGRGREGFHDPLSARRARPQACARARGRHDRLRRLGARRPAVRPGQAPPKDYGTFPVSSAGMYAREERVLRWPRRCTR